LEQLVWVIDKGGEGIGRKEVQRSEGDGLSDWFTWKIYSRTCINPLREILQDNPHKNCLGNPFSKTWWPS